MTLNLLYKIIFASTLVFISSCAIIDVKANLTEPKLTKKQITANLVVSKQKTIYAENQPKIYTNIWFEIADNTSLEPHSTHNYNSYIPYYKKYPDYLKRVSKRAEPYLYFILSEVKKRQMPYEIALLPIIESAFYPFAKSYISATGLWQFMPNTGEMLGLYRNWWYEGRQDIYKSTHAALEYLQKLYKKNNNDWLLALASYNAGYGNVSKAKRKFLKKHPNEIVDFWAIKKYLPKETQNYVPTLLAISHIIENPKEYNIELYPIENKPFFDSTILKQQLDINKIAKITNTDFKIIKRLNPGFLRSATPPTGKYKLLLPIENLKLFEDKLLEQPSYFKVNWAKHTIKSGESLSVIAQKYRTSTAQIKRLNNLRSDFIRVGKYLLIPITNTAAQQLLNQPIKKYNGKKHYHKVKKGESLWVIARYYNVSTRTLCQWNNISIRKPLRKGQKLEIRNKKYGKKITYTITKGDSLWKIAHKHSVSIADLVHWNGIKKHQILKPKTKLNIWIKG